MPKIWFGLFEHTKRNLKNETETETERERERQGCRLYDLFIRFCVIIVELWLQRLLQTALPQLAFHCRHEQMLRLR
jgi:hypothetical protein